MTYFKQLIASVSLACALASGLSPEIAGCTRHHAPHRLTPVHDANHNGVDDTVDIATGISLDENLNNVPDEAEGR